MTNGLTHYYPIDTIQKQEAVTNFMEELSPMANSITNKDKDKQQSIKIVLVFVDNSLQKQLLKERYFQKTKTSKEIFLEKLHQVLTKHYQNEELDVYRLAALMEMSYTQLYRKFRAFTNERLARYVLNFRLEKAKSMLLKPDNDWNVSEIAYNSGFTDPNYFSRSFKALFGKSPKAIQNAK